VAALVGAVFFFGRGKVIGWAKTIGEAKRAMKDAESGTSETATKE